MGCFTSIVMHFCIVDVCTYISASFSTCSICFWCNSFSCTCSRCEAIRQICASSMWLQRDVSRSTPSCPKSSLLSRHLPATGDRFAECRFHSHNNENTGHAYRILPQWNASSHYKSHSDFEIRHWRACQLITQNSIAYPSWRARSHPKATLIIISPLRWISPSFKLDGVFTFGLFFSVEEKILSISDVLNNSYHKWNDWSKC